MGEVADEKGAYAIIITAPTTCFVFYTLSTFLRIVHLYQIFFSGFQTICSVPLLSRPRERYVVSLRLLEYSREYC